MPGDPAAKKRQASIHQREMQRMPYQIVDQHRDAAGAQRFIHKLNRLFRRQMVRKKIAAHHVKRSVAKGKRQRVAGHRAQAIRRPECHCALVQMRPDPIQQADPQAIPSGRTRRWIALGICAGAGRNFQKRQRLASRFLRHLLDHGFRGGQAPETSD